jgi:hypothetical protein
MKTEIQKHNIEPRIFTIRGVQVMLDRDLAELFGTSTKRVNEIVKRNSLRFPPKYIIKLNESEKNELVANCDHLRSLKFSYKLPTCFSEFGVAMLATLLKSDIAIEMSIHIINSFVQYRNNSNQIKSLISQISEIQNELITTNQRVDEVFSFMKIPDVKKTGVFFNDQVFDAYIFSCELIQKAKKSIVLIDNYIDETTLLQLSKRQSTAVALIYTEKITPQLKLDLQKHNSQYPSIDVSTLKKVHDRFIIIDDTELYHLGASLKDLGKKWFAFSRIDSILPEIISKLHDKKPFTTSR